MKEYRLLRPVAKHWAIGSDFLKWGKSWHSHFDDAGNWVKGQVELNGEHLGQHTGVDFLVPKGTPVIAPLDGRISWARFGPMLGNCVKIEADRAVLNHMGWDCLPTVALAHLDSFAEGIVEGKFVYRGTLLGYSGATGNVSGPHLHVQMTQPDGRPMRIAFYDLEEAKPNA